MFYIQRRQDCKVVYISKRFKQVVKFMLRLSPEAYGYYEVSQDKRNNRALQAWMTSQESSR